MAPRVPRKSVYRRPINPALTFVFVFIAVPPIRWPGGSCIVFRSCPHLHMRKSKEKRLKKGKTFFAVCGRTYYLTVTVTPTWVLLFPTFTTIGCGPGASP